MLDDKRTVFLEVPGIAPVMQMQISYDLVSRNDEDIVGAVYNTIHELGAPVKT